MTRPIVRATLAGICRERGTAPKPKTALLVDELRSALATCGERRIDVRDRALMLIGFAGALRRSEVVGLDVADVRFEAEGVVLRLRRSKTNQEGALEEVAVLYGSDPRTCPVRAVQAWLAISGLVNGPLFRAVDRAGHVGSGRLTARIVGERLKKISVRAGLDPQSYAAHSLRSGFATSAARANKSEAAIMRQGRWKSIPVARRYIRAGSRWHDHAAANIGLQMGTNPKLVVMRL
jgi:integrase